MHLTHRQLRDLIKALYETPTAPENCKGPLDTPMRYSVLLFGIVSHVNSRMQSVYKDDLDEYKFSHRSFLR